MNKNNYHTHTTRCYHASGKDEEYVKAAIKAGIKELGFSDHTPWHYASSFKATMRIILKVFVILKKNIKIKFLF